VKGDRDGCASADDAFFLEKSGYVVVEACKKCIDINIDWMIQPDLGYMLFLEPVTETLESPELRVCVATVS
jgi:hypothetical protein